MGLVFPALGVPYPHTGGVRPARHRIGTAIWRDCAVFVPMADAYARVVYDEITGTELIRGSVRPYRTRFGTGCGSAALNAGYALRGADGWHPITGSNGDGTGDYTLAAFMAAPPYAETAPIIDQRSVGSTTWAIGLWANGYAAHATLADGYAPGLFSVVASDGTNYSSNWSNQSVLNGRPHLLGLRSGAMLYDHRQIADAFTARDFLDTTQTGAIAIGGHAKSTTEKGARFPIFWAAAWNRALTDAEWRSMANRPDWWVRPAQRKIFLPAFAAGGAGVTLTVADSAHAHAVDSPALVQANIITLADALHAHAADGDLALSQAVTLALADAAHAHAAEAPALLQAHVLTLADASHLHAADGPLALTQAHVLVLADAAHAQLADGPLTLSVLGVLTVADAAHAHAADATALVQAHVLALADAAHAHAAESPILSIATLLALADAAHAHAADGDLALTQAQILALADALHAHAAEGLTLSGPVTLVVSDALHAHLADRVGLGGIAWASPDARVLRVAAEDRVLLVMPETRTLTVH